MQIINGPGRGALVRAYGTHIVKAAKKGSPSSKLAWTVSRAFLRSKKKIEGLRGFSHWYCAIHIHMVRVKLAGGKGSTC